MREAGLAPQEAHALNVLWDAYRNVTRPGQGSPQPGPEGVDALTERGLAKEETITPEGIAFREALEADTDTRTAPLYASAPTETLQAFLEALRSLPT